MRMGSSSPTSSTKRTRVPSMYHRRGHATSDRQLGSSSTGRRSGILERGFCADVVLPAGGQLYLSVRQENTPACRIYERHGMTMAGTVIWKSGTIPGLVYFRNVG